MAILSALYSVILASYVVYLIAACRQAHTNRPPAGQYCMNYFNLRQGVTQQTCFLYCMRNPECKALSYNAGEQKCLLTAEPCVTTEADSGYVYMTFKEVTEECLTWFDTSDGLNARMIRMAEDPSHPMLDYVLTREVNDTHTSIPYTRMWYLGGDPDTVYTVLVVAPGCSTAWVAYTAGDPLPQGAVPTGGLTNGNPTYDIRALSDWGPYYFGYYEKNAAVGYYRDEYTTSVMEMLIEI